MPPYSSTVSRQNAAVRLALLLVASSCRIRDDSQRSEPTKAAQVPVVQLEEIAAHPLELLEPVATIPELRASPGPAIALLVATGADDVLTAHAREAWKLALAGSGAEGAPFALLEQGFLAVEGSALLGAGPGARTDLMFEAALMDAAADFGAVVGVPLGHQPRLLALSVLHSEVTLASYAGPVPALDAGVTASRIEPARSPAPLVAAAMIVRSATGELGAAAEMGALPTFPMTVGSVALPGGTLHVEGNTAVIVLSLDPWFARAGFARKLHGHQAASGTDPATSLGWAREQLDGHDPVALALVTRHRHAVWTSPEAFSAVHIWAPAPSGDPAPAPLASGPAAPAQLRRDAGARSPRADAGATRRTPP